MFLYTSHRSVCGVRLFQGSRVLLVLTVLRAETDRSKGMEKGLNASLSHEPVLVFVFMHMNWNYLTGDSNSWGFF